MLGLIAWVVAAALAARSVPDALSEHPRVAQIAVYGMAIVGGLGGLVGFWCSADSIEFFMRGYRVRSFNHRTQWVYEERMADGSIEGLTFTYKRLADGYRPPCEIRLMSQERWDDEVPVWARHRRSEIMEHIANCLGADVGAGVQFVDQGPPTYDEGTAG